MSGLPQPSSRIVGEVTDPVTGNSEAVTGYVITSGSIAVEVWDHGARIVGVFAPDADGQHVNVAYRYPTPVDYTVDGHGYVGATIGRYANRIGRAEAPIGPTVVRLAPNEGDNQLHGGPVGFDQHVWTTLDRTDSSVAFQLVSPDGDQGFPGAVTARVDYSIDGETLTIETTAVSDADTIFAATNHAYWNLAGHGTVADHELYVPASRYVEVGDDLIPTGELLPTMGTMVDFAEARPLAGALEGGGIDHCLVADDGAATARLFHPGSGRLLEVWSNQPGIQVYTGNHLSTPFAAMCLEPEVLPDTPNRPEFGSALLTAGERYRHLMTCRFSVAASVPGDHAD